MTLSELIATLQDLANDCDGHDPEVRIAQQPSWPFEYRLSEAVLVDLDADDHEPPHPTTTYGEPRLFVYLGEGGQIGYLPGAAKDALGW
ncbi:hypothetical protein [Roseinatronobacter sp. S2]|uniref:hypothetical protein n=1 Tax=Roseinatronobacter sp. S2 TaxID=3035471 RepID=UPI00240F0CD7|nr:hypothetical protein [Roseinatronobacter sp. S2]WFE74246.1 hypothetical protein P8S53_13800 [Roseinatronobacter sp. S2]